METTPMLSLMIPPNGRIQMETAAVTIQTGSTATPSGKILTNGKTPMAMATVTI
jgi:hypothetical protein